MAVEFGVLGSIEARIDGRLADLGHTRQRLLLAALLMNLNNEVSTDQLAERIWGHEQALRGTLHGYLSRLRRALDGAEGVEIARRPAGYVLAADPDTLDLYRFRDLVSQARAATDDKSAADLYERAIGLWRGKALTGTDTAWAGTVREDLHQERLAAELDRGEVRLRLGQHSDMLAGLRSLTAEFPLDERLAGQLMLALYRCGRTAEALAHYQETHRVLARELGIDPGLELRQLHQRILTGDSALASGAAARDTFVMPRQLPAPPARFTGRTRELDRLSAVLEEGVRTGGTVVVSAIGGTGGIGKTYLALHWAHGHVEGFPDGQLYVNLRGFDPAGEPMDPSVAVRGFLEALGVEHAAVPDRLDAQAGLYRTLVAGKRMLIVLDDARDANQVIPLLPGSPGCTVLITSRNQLTGLITTHAAKPLPLGTLPENEARELLARHLGEVRLAAEPQAVTALLEHCAGLPLALSIIAARAAVHPDLPLAHLAEELAETETRLDALDDLTANLRVVFATSHRTLSPVAARMFALLGLVPGPDVSLHAAASLAGQSTIRTRSVLRTLEDVNLVQQHPPGRYRMHDLVRLFAAEQGQTLDKRDRDAALRRLISFYLHTAHHTGLLLEPQPLFPVELDPPVPGCVPLRPTDRTEALTWYDTERPCLLAAQRLTVDLGWHSLTWQLPQALDTFHRYRDRFRDALEMWQVGMAAAERLADPYLSAVAHSHLGHFHARLHPLDEALDHLGRALSVFEETGDLPGQAFTHFSCFVVVSGSAEGRDVRRGLFHARRAGQLYRSLGNALGESYALSDMGWCHARLGEHQQARDCCERSLALARGLNNPCPESYALIRLGFATHRGGDHFAALAYYHQAITILRDHNNTYWEAVASRQLGRVHRALGQTAEARHAWQHALNLYRALHYTAQAKRLQRQLDELVDAPADTWTQRRSSPL